MKKLQVIYDSQIFDAQRFGGISRYFCEIIPKMDIDFNIAVRYSENVFLKTSGIDKHRLPIPQWIFNRFKKKLLRKNKRFSKRLMQADAPYLLHATYYEPYFLEYIGSNPYVITVHDMTYEKLPDHFSEEEKAIVIRQKKEVITRANRIIAISQNTKKDIIDILDIAPEKIDVIYHGTNMQQTSNEKEVISLPKRYILYVGARCSYKNFERFAKAFALLSAKDKDLYAICTGNAFSPDESQLLGLLGIENRMIQIHASDNILHTLYLQAEAFVFPSLYEGFGIPILEAYACHCPTVISNASCFPEIAADASAYFDPYSEKEMADSIADVIYSPNLRDELIQKGTERLKLYSWTKAALQTQEVYQKVINNQ